MDEPLTIVGLRAELGLSLDAFARAIGLKSKGNASVIENGGRCSVRVALAIEALSNGRIRAAALNPEVALVESVRSGAADPLAHAPVDSGASETISTDKEEAGVPHVPDRDTDADELAFEPELPIGTPDEPELPIVQGIAA